MSNNKLIGIGKYRIGDFVSFQHSNYKYYNGEIVDIRVKVKSKIGLKFIQYKVLIPSLKSHWLPNPSWWFNENAIIHKVENIEGFNLSKIKESNHSLFQRIKLWVMSVLK